MTQHYPALIIILPLMSAFIIITAGLLTRKLCFPVAAAALGATLAAAVGLLVQVLAKKNIIYFLGGWPPPWGIAYAVDSFNAVVLVVVSFVAFINVLATRQIVARDFTDKIGAFYTLYVLFVSGLLGIVVTGDAFNLYVLLEIAALTGYALIGMGTKHAPLASLNYIFMGTIGASFYLLGIGYLYLQTGSLNMENMATLLPAISNSKIIWFAFAITMAGLFVKMALFPLHGWLPKAYSNAPSSVTSLVAPLTTKVMVYVMVRMVISVFTTKFAFGTLQVSTALVWVAVIAIVSGSLMALIQNRIKSILTYIIIAEVGYMVGGFWLGNRSGMTGAMIHIVNDAIMTLCMFLATNNILYTIKTDRLDRLSGLFKKMPFTMSAFIIGTLSLIGVPPTCGFFSKWYLINGAIEAGSWAFAAALIFSSLINVVLFFRIIEFAYYEQTDHNHTGPELQINEAPVHMVVPALVVAALLIIVGVYTGEIVTYFIAPVIPAEIL